jgi:hypothetical protein
VAADGSNFKLIRPDGVLMKPVSAKAINCVGDSASGILIEFGQAFFTNMRAPFLVGKSATGGYIISACAQRPWVYDSLAIVVSNCFVTDVNITGISQISSQEVEINWTLDSGTANAPFPWYLFSSYQVYRRIGAQGQFLFLDSIAHIDSTHFVDKFLPSGFIGTIAYFVSAKLQNLELDFDTAAVYVILKTNAVAYPVPFQEQLELALAGDGEKEVSIFTQQGLPLFSIRTRDFYLVIPTDAWPKGVYIIRVSGKEEVMQRVVKF